MSNAKILKTDATCNTSSSYNSCSLQKMSYWILTILDFHDYIVICAYKIQELCTDHVVINRDIVLLSTMRHSFQWNAVEFTQHAFSWSKDYAWSAI